MNTIWTAIVEGLSNKTTPKEWAIIEKKAYSWTTNVVSELDIEREKGSQMPIDLDLRDLAIEFFKGTVYQDIPAMESLLREVNRRMTELKVEKNEGDWVDLAVIEAGIGVLTYFKVREKWDSPQIDAFLENKKLLLGEIKYCVINNIIDKR